MTRLSIAVAKLALGAGEKCDGLVDVSDSPTEDGVRAEQPIRRR